MRKITKKTAVIVAGSTLLVAVGGGIAFAYWTSSGSGTGSATTSAGTSNLSVSQSNAPSGLAPGVAPVAVTGTITNNASNSAHVTSLIVTISSVSGGQVGCTAADYGLTTDTAALDKATAVQSITVTVGSELASGQSVGFPAFNVGFANSSTANQDACKGASPQLTYSTN